MLTQMKFHHDHKQTKYRTIINWLNLIFLFSVQLINFTLCVAMTGAEDSESCENRNGAASALLHIDESDGVDDINRQRNKSRRRSEPRQVQTGKNSTQVWTLQRFERVTSSRLQYQSQVFLVVMLARKISNPQDSSLATRPAMGKLQIAAL